MGLEENALYYLDTNKDKLANLAKDIWDHPELGLLEFRSSRLIADELEKAGFSVERGVAQMPTAFVASWGEGKPMIGLPTQYDALPGLSQKVSATKEAVEEGAPGHGCGHNLLAVGSLGAALAAKEAMEKGRIRGTIRYYGCPAEEGLVGKVFMARAGVFNDLDAAISWHPGYENSAGGRGSSLALNSFKVNFHGMAAHAVDTPEAGRSALDAAQLIDVGVHYLRNHIVQEAYVHGVITGGGESPNIVPDYAQVWYYVRAPSREQVDDIYSRVLDVAKGAALMTGTTYDVDFLTGCHDLLPNETIGAVLLEKLKEVGAPKFTDEERDFARQLQKTLRPGAIEMSVRTALERYHDGVTREDLGNPFCEKIIDPTDQAKVVGGSTDVGDVSYITPTAQISTCCCKPLGVLGHSWQKVVSVGSSIGMKGMMVAAKAMVLATLDFATKPEILKAARDEFEEKTAGKKYVSALPEGTVPH